MSTALFCQGNGCSKRKTIIPLVFLPSQEDFKTAEFLWLQPQLLQWIVRTMGAWQGGICCQARRECEVLYLDSCFLYK